METSGETTQPELQSQTAPTPEVSVAHKVHSPKKAGWGRKLLFAFRRHHDENSIVVHSYSKFIFCWPLLALGLIGYLWSLTGTPPAALSWVYVASVAIVLLAISFDVSRDWTMIWGLVALVVTFFLLWLGSANEVPVFRTFWHWLGRLEMPYPVNFSSSIAVVLTPVFVGVIIHARLNQKWKISRNELEHFKFFSSDDSIGRGAKQFVITFPDILERFLLLAGTITVKSAGTGQTLKTIPNVPFLVLHRRRIDRILSSVSMTPQLGDEDDGTEHHDEREGEDTGDGHGG